MTDQLSRTDIDAALAEAKRQISDNWGWFLALGVLLIVAGVAAIGAAPFASLAVEIFVAYILLVAGVAFVIHAFLVKGWQGFLLQLLVGALYLAAGGWLLLYPVSAS